MPQSIATIDSPEFVNLQPTDINPTISTCDIKVLYTGGNRNRSFIHKNVATELAKSLRGSPIVGYYKEEKKDFADHGHQIIMEGDRLEFKCLTFPYGFVAPDAKVWFQKFQDTDDFGNVIEREYLMTTGFLWTGQYPECQRVVDKGNPQSMELYDDETLKGKWSTDNKTGLDFFIINDAIFKNLCILGEDVEPCFEGADIGASQYEYNNNKNGKKFTTTLFTMMQDLEKLIKYQGGNHVENNNQTVEDPVVFANNNEDDDKKKKDPKQNSTAEPSTNNEDKGKTKQEPAANEPKDNKNNTKSSDDEEDKDKKKKAKDFELLEESLQTLQTNYSNLEQQFNTLKDECSKLRTFKCQVEEKEKDQLIDSFYMLSDEDKKDVIENKATYSLSDIESKLSVICVRKKVNFDLDDSAKNQNKVEENPTVTFNLDNNESNDVPAWISALKNARKN